MHKLDAAIADRFLLNHPFYQRWVAGELKKSELQRYVIQYFPHVAAFPTYVSSVHAQSDDIALRKELLENLIEEERGEEHHPELWLRFGEAIGVSRSETGKAEPIKEARELVETFRRLTRKSVASGLGALYAYESQVPDIAEKKIDGLKKYYGLEDPEGLKFFTVHLAADKYHSATARKAIDRLSAREQMEATESAKEASQALWNFLSALDRVERLKRYLAPFKTTNTNA